jgi:hypothetical protein
MSWTIAKLFDEVTTTKVEMENRKPRVTDEHTIAQQSRSSKRIAGNHAKSARRSPL